MKRTVNLTTEDWQAVLEIHGRIAQRISSRAIEELYSAADRVGLRPAELFHFVYVIENFDLFALSVNPYNKRDPFDHPDVVQNHLDNWAKAGWIEIVENGRFQISDDGEQICYDVPSLDSKKEPKSKN